MFFKWILWIVTAWAPMNPDQPPWMWSYLLSRTTPRATASWSAGQPPCWGCVSVWSTSTRTSLPPSSGSFSRTLNRLEMQFAEVLSCSVLSRRRVWAKKKGLRIKNLNLDILNSFVSEKGDDLEGGIYCNCPENCNDVVYSQEIIKLILSCFSSGQLFSGGHLSTFSRHQQLLSAKRSDRPMQCRSLPNIQ